MRILIALVAIALTALWFWPSEPSSLALPNLPASSSPLALSYESVPASASASAPVPASVSVPALATAPLPSPMPMPVPVPEEAWPDDVPDRYQSDALWEILPDYMPEGAELATLSCAQFPCIATIVGGDDYELISEMRKTLDVEEDLESLSSFSFVDGGEAGELVYQVTFVPDVLVTDELLARAEYRETVSQYTWDVQRGDTSRWTERPISADRLADYESVYGKVSKEVLAALGEELP